MAASYPGLPEERMPTGLVSIMAVVIALGMHRLRLRPPVPVASRRARSLALAARPGSSQEAPEKQAEQRSGQPGSPWLFHESQRR